MSKTRPPATGAPARRRLAAASTVVTAVAAVAVLLVEGPPGSGYGWGSVVISSVLVGVPLLVAGWLVRQGDARSDWTAAVLTLLVAGVLLLALVGNWSGQSPRDRVLDSVVALLVCAAAAAVVSVALTHTGTDPPG